MKLHITFIASMRLLVGVWLCCMTLASYTQSPNWDAEKRTTLRQQCERYGTKTMIIFQGSEIKFTYGDPTQKYKVFSIRKSLVSLLFGIAEDENLINLSTTLKDLEIDDIGGLSNLEKQATILDLLQARSGVYHPAAFETPGMNKKRPARGSHEPGTFWYYNNWDFNVLNTIIESKMNTSVFHVFDDKIAKPIGLQDYDISDHEYVNEPEKSVHAASVWSLSGRDLMQIGKLVLNEGNWKEVQVIPQDWIRRSTIKYSNLGMFGAYGLCWWVAHQEQHYPFVTFPKGTFSARGTGMQDLIIVPSYDMVIVHQTDVKGPDDIMMKVTDLGRILKVVMDQ